MNLNSLTDTIGNIANVSVSRKQIKKSYKKSVDAKKCGISGKGCLRIM